ncbi:hypothetical protein EV126DRAFT_342542 [Verticillium dahliae]|nr:hypothetical protein EV126DRAFT_342542 [Verticillium dahliae]
MDTNEEIAESRKRQTLFPGAHSTGNSLEGILDVPPKSHKRFAEASQKQNASRSKLQRSHDNYLTIFQETDQLKAPGLKSKLPVKEGSPWNLYRRYLTLELGGTVAVVGKTNQTELFLMRGYRNDSAEENLDPLAVLQHPNLLQYHDCFQHDNAFYVVFEYAEISIKELMEIRLDESELVAIVHQVCRTVRYTSLPKSLMLKVLQIVECLAYLEQMKTCHGAVNESNILLTRQGHVKIGGHHTFKQSLFKSNVNRRS